MDSLEQQITQLKQQHKQGYLGTWAFDQSAVDLDDLLDVIFEAHEDDIKFRSTLEMYEIHRLQKYEWAPPYLLRLLEQAQNTSLLKSADIVAFVSETSGNGYGWHDDLFAQHTHTHTASARAGCASSFSPPSPGKRLCA